MKGIILHAGAISCCALAQTTAFEVVSLKPDHSGTNSGSSKNHQGALTGTNLTLKWLIVRACQVRDCQIVNLPGISCLRSVGFKGWIEGKRRG
jgi:hypothetical protein